MQRLVGLDIRYIGCKKNVLGLELERYVVVGLKGQNHVHLFLRASVLNGKIASPGTHRF